MFGCCRRGIGCILLLLVRRGGHCVGHWLMGYWCQRMRWMGWWGCGRLRIGLREGCRRFVRRVGCWGRGVGCRRGTSFLSSLFLRLRWGGGVGGVCWSSWGMLKLLPYGSCRILLLLGGLGWCCLGCSCGFLFRCRLLAILLGVRILLRWLRCLLLFES